MKKKCVCGHNMEAHAPKEGFESYDGECCIQYRGKEGCIKCCPCVEFQEVSP